MTMSALERECLGWVGTMDYPTTAAILRKVQRTNPKAGRMSVSRALKALEAEGVITNMGLGSTAWKIP